ncbi:hypothetical protein [Chitinophaga varians]|nr:hypothetical protein [Chitinophaga varians]
MTTIIIVIIITMTTTTTWISVTAAEQPAKPFKQFTKEHNKWF